jgi:hypothetical protein
MKTKYSIVPREELAKMIETPIAMQITKIPWSGIT